MQRHDLRRTEIARAEKAEDARTPGKRTLTDGGEGGTGAMASTARWNDPANEAAKGGADNNSKQGTNGGGDEATDAHAQTGAARARAPGKGAGAIGNANVVDSASDAVPASTSESESKREAKAESWVEAVFGGSGRGGAGQVQSTSASGSASGREAKQQAVKPTASPTFNGSAGANNCTPGDATGASIAWTVVAGATTWGVSVTSFTTTGTINVAPWPNKPTDMVTPNTANPVDGGNIENKPGSNNDWKFAIKEMKEYNQAGGGRSSYWHSYEASKAHEWEHWNTDWLKGIVEPLWPAVNTDLDAITIPKADALNEAAARPLLQAKIDARMKTFDRELTRKWNAVPDTPGQAGANGYIAGQKVLNGLISAVQAYGKTKGW
jgi:hypothetical protein